MTIIVGPLSGGDSGSGVDASEAFIFKQDFTAVDRATAESDRDTYYTNNPLELGEMDTNLNWFITLSFIDLGVSRVLAQVRRSGTWATLGSSSEIDFTNMTDGEVAIYNQATGKLVGRDVFIDEAGSLTVGTNSLSLGQVHTMSSGYENVMFRNDVSETPYHPVWQDASISGNEIPTARIYSAPLLTREVVPENGDDKSGSVSNPDYVGIPSTNDRLFSIYLESVTTITNVTATLVDIATGNNVYRIELGTLTADTEKQVVLNVPIDVRTSINNRLEIRSPDGIVTLKADVTNTYPWLAFDVRSWEDLAVAITEDIKGGYATYADLNTHTTPIPTLPNVWTNITNDGLGDQTDLLHLPPNVTSLWDTFHNKLLITELKPSDIVEIRLDFSVVPSRNNTIVDLELEVNIKDSLGVVVEVISLPFFTNQLGRGAGVSYDFSSTKSYGLQNDTIIDMTDTFIKVRTTRNCNVTVDRIYVEVRR